MILRFRAMTLAFVLGLVALTVTLPGQANATITYQDRFGGLGPADGQFTDARGVASDSSGNIYAVDRGTNRIEKFAADGTYLTTFGSGLSVPAGIAVSPDDYVFVSDYGNDRVVKYESSGTELLTFPVPEPGDLNVGSNGNIYVLKNDNQFVGRFDADGSALNAWGSEGNTEAPFPDAAGISVDPLDNRVYVSTVSADKIQVFTSFGGFNGLLPVTSPGPLTVRAGLIYVVRSSTNTVAVYTTNASFQYAFAGNGSTPGLLAAPQAIAVSPVGDAVYVTDNSNGFVSIWSHVPPDAVLSPPTGITSDSVAFNAEINPNGLSTSYHFEWGPTLAMANSTTNGDAGVGTSPVLVSAGISGLVRGRTYYYRVVASNSDGSASSPIDSFTTDSVAPIASTDPATSVTDTSATLEATIDNGGASTDYYFEYGLTIAYGSSTALNTIPATTDPGQVSASLSSLMPNTTYHYRIVATNANGSAIGSDRIVTTDAALASITNVNADTITSASAELHAQINPNGSDTDWVVEWGPSVLYGSTTSQVNIGSGGSYVAADASLVGLLPNMTYHYRYAATSASGTKYSDDFTFQTTPLSPSVTTAAASGVTTSAATLNGAVNPNNDSTTYQFEWGTTTSYGQTTSLASAGSGASSVNVNAYLPGLSSGSTYHYRLIATNSFGTTVGSDVSFTTFFPPPLVTTNAASLVSASSARLNATVNPSGNSTDYHFEYGPTTMYGSSTPTVSAGSGTGNQSVFSDVSLPPNSTYHFRIVATNVGGTTNGADVTVTTSPMAPSLTLGQVTGIDLNSATISYSLISNNSNTNYFISYGTTMAFGQNTPSSMSPASMSAVPGSYTFNTLASNKTYYYKMTAVNEGGTYVTPTSSFTTTSAPARPDPQDPPVTKCDKMQMFTSGPTYSSITNIGFVALIRIQGPSGSYVDNSTASIIPFRVLLDSSAKGKTKSRVLTSGVSYTLDGDAISVSKGVAKIKADSLKDGSHELTATVTYGGQKGVSTYQFGAAPCQAGKFIVKGKSAPRKSMTISATTGSAKLKSATLLMTRSVYSGRAKQTIGTLNITQNRMSKKLTLRIPKKKSGVLVVTPIAKITIKYKKGVATISVSEMQGDITGLSLVAGKSKGLSFKRCPTVTGQFVDSIGGHAQQSVKTCAKK